MNTNFKAILVIALLFVMSVIVMAQSTVTGAIGGTVTDPNKKVVPNAAVMVSNIDTNKEATVATDAEGRFQIMALQPGNYILKVSVPGFNPFQVNKIVVEVGRITTVGASLAGAGPDYAVTISNTPTINTAQQDFSTNINQTSINELPINGRRWSNFALGTPTAAPDGFNVSFRGISGVQNNNTIDGGDNNQAIFSEERGRIRIAYAIGLDSIREFQINSSNYSAEYGRAAGGVINAVTKSGTNNFHGSAFYYIRDNKWGARNPRGFQTVLINSVLNTVPLKPVDQRQQFGGTIGGPVAKNRLFFFFSYDQQKRNFPAIATTINPAFFTTVDRGTTGAGLKAPNRLLTDAQIDSTVAFLTSLTGELARRGDQTIYLPKIDWHITDKHTFTATYNRLRWNSPGGMQIGTILFNGRQSSADDFVNVDWLNLRLISTLNSRLINEARFYYGRDNEFDLSKTPAPGEPTTGPHGKPPEISIGGGLIFGKLSFLERRAYPDEKRWQYADTITQTRGTHTIKFGLDFNRVNDLMDNLNTEEGQYTYSTINDFIMDYVNFTTNGALRAASRVCSGSTRLAGQCYTGNFRQAFGPSAFRFQTNDYNFFVQDGYRVAPRLTLNLGLRYEHEQLPAPQIRNQLANLSGLAFGPEQTGRFPSDKNNFGPRLGFAYDLKGNGKMVIRGGYGIYYGRIINSTIYSAIINTGVAESQRIFQINVASTPAIAPIFPSTLAGPTGTTAAPNIVVFDPKMQAPLIHEADFVFERLIATNTVLSVAYILSPGRDLPTFIDFNLPAPTTRIYSVVGGDFNGQTVTVPFFASPRPDARFGGITVIQSRIRSKYNALVLQANRRLTKGLQFNTTYAFAKGTDNGQNSSTSGTFSNTNNPFNPLDLSFDQAPTNFDIRHKFSAAFIWSPKFSASDHGVARALFNGFTFAPVFVAVSGTPFTAVTGGAPAGGVSGGITGAGSVFNRVPLFPRNFFRQPRVWNLDMRISRRFHLTEKLKLEVLADAFNLFNRTQVTGVNTRLYIVGGGATTSTLTFDPAFGTISETGNTSARERQIQLAVRFQF